MIDIVRVLILRGVDITASEDKCDSASVGINSCYTSEAYIP